MYKKGFDEVHLDLLALRQLYMLLLKSCHGLQDANSGLLDERAKILLKRLLDDAAAGLFEAHSKEPPKAISKTYRPFSEAVYRPVKLVQGSPSVLSNLSSSSIKPETSKKQCGVCTKRSIKQKNLDRPSMISENVVVNFSRDCCHPNQQKDWSSYLARDGKLTEPQDKKVSERMELNQSLRKMGNPEIEENPSLARSSAYCTSYAGIESNKSKARWFLNSEKQDVDVASNDLAYGVDLAIKRIDFHISSLQRCTSQSSSTRNHISNEAELANSSLKRCNAGQSDLPGNETLSQRKSQLRTDYSTLRALHVASSPSYKPVLTGNKSLNQMGSSKKVFGFGQPRSQMLHDGKFTESIIQHNLPSQNTSHHLGRQKVESRVRGVESSLNGASLSNHSSLFVHGFRIPLGEDNEGRKAPTVGSRISKGNKVTNTIVMKHESREIERSKRSLPPPSMGSKTSVRPGKDQSQIRMQERYQNLPSRMIMKPTLLDHPSRGLRMSSPRTRGEKVGREKRIQKKIQVGPCIQNGHKGSRYENSESASSASSWTSQQTSIFSSETNYYSSSPSQQEGPTSSGSEESSFISNPNGFQRSSSSSRMAPAKTFRFSHGKGSKKAIGRLKRLKNRLGLIFHHHHHHHHHHHNVGDDRGNFMWKQLRKIFHGADKKKVTSKERGGRKMKKSAIKKVSRRNQVARFQALAEGFRSHVLKSKAMKRELSGMGRRTMGVKKLHWWQMFRRHRGVKLPKRGRVKIGYVNKKPHKTT